MKDKPKTIIVGDCSTGLTGAYISGGIYKPPISLIVSPQIKRIIEPHEKPSKIYNKHRCGMLPKDKEPTPIVPLPMSYRTDKNKYTTTVNRKKHLATCAKNRRNRKSKKRKNR